MVRGVFRVFFLLVLIVIFFTSPSVAGDMAMAFVDDLFLHLKARSSFHFFAYFAGFVALPFRGMGVGFEEPHLRLMF